MSDFKIIHDTEMDNKTCNLYSINDCETGETLSIFPVAMGRTGSHNYGHGDAWTEWKIDDAGDIEVFAKDTDTTVTLPFKQTVVLTTQEPYRLQLAELSHFMGLNRLKLQCLIGKLLI